MRRTTQLATLALLAACSTNASAPVEESLLLASDNRTELEAVLGHYRRAQDPQKLQAAQFLIGNMSSKGAIRYELVAQDGKPLSFDALRFPDLARAQAELDRIETKYPGAEFERTEFDRDVERITAEYLIENIDLAFEAWRTKPWSQQYSFDVFQQYILPYRGSNEPLSSWRKDCMAQWADLDRRLTDPTDAREAARVIREEVNDWIRFSDLYYLHPTDQSYAEMRRSGVGRCEDISNLAGFALRANAIPVATDFTPWWANRDNNHAWEVVLDGAGQGNAALSNRAAKVYRKTFAMQRDCLTNRLPIDTEVPRWLDRDDFIDVTTQYQATTDVELQLASDAADHAAYLCVFNGGEWRAIVGTVLTDTGIARFPAMGREICYLPAWYRGGVLIPAAPAFVLRADGGLQSLSASAELEEVALRATGPDSPDADTGTVRPAIPLQPEVEYELFSWTDEWTSLGSFTLNSGTTYAPRVPRGALLWLVQKDSRRLERIFSVADGTPLWW